MHSIRFGLRLFFLASLLTAPAFAQRSFPQGVKPAQLRDITYPNVTIDSKTYRMTPGARIYDTNNRMVVPNSAPKSGMVLFKLDGQGNLMKLWILTPEEIARLSQ